MHTTPVEEAFADEAEQYGANLAAIKHLDEDDRDAAFKAERRRHMWAICGIWHGRPFWDRLINPGPAAS